MRQRILWLAVLAVATPAIARGSVIDFEDLSLPVPPAGGGSHYNGSDEAGGFTSGGAFFNNDYSPLYDAWLGWSYSNERNTTSASYTNQYSSFAGGGAGGSDNFGVLFSFAPGDAFVRLPAGTRPVSIDVTNITYPALLMRDGDPFGFAKKFGGGAGNDPDYFSLTIIGRQERPGLPDLATGSVEVGLADYRFQDHSLDYILSHWLSVDLSALGNANKLWFEFHSSDVGDYGINTPTYAAIDNIVVTPVPEMSGLALMAGAGGLILAVRRRWGRRR